MKPEYPFAVAANRAVYDSNLNTLTKAFAEWRAATGAKYDRDYNVMASRLMGVASECGEAYNARRKGTWDDVEEEVADICIRLFGFIGLSEINIESAIMRKMHKNMGEAK